MNYKQLTQEERYHIYGLSKAGHSPCQIAQELKRHRSTIGRELKRNKGLKGYRPKQAQKLTELRRTSAKKHIKLTPEVKGWVDELLKEDLSPEQVVGRVELEVGIKLHHESIYRYVYQDKADGGSLCQHLTRANKKYRKRYGSYDKRGQLVDRVSIDDRPKIVDQKVRIGDWEGDTVVGKGRKNALVTMVDRVSLYTVVARIESKHAPITALALIESMRALKEKVLTITFDNGREFANHKLIAEQLGADVYFAHPYSSWERGINENTNGLLRRYFPKGTDFMSLSEEQIQLVVNKLNRRPRKTRGYKTPHEIFTGQTTKLVGA